jgi:hypothetical protein
VNDADYGAALADVGLDETWDVRSLTGSTVSQPEVG